MVPQHGSSSITARFFNIIVAITMSVVLAACGTNIPLTATTAGREVPAPTLVVHPSDTPQGINIPAVTLEPTSVNGRQVPPASTLPVLNFRDYLPEVPPGLGKQYSHLVFFSNVSGVYLLYQINLDGTGLTQLSKNTGLNVYDLEPAWSADGKIAFTSNHVNGNWEIFVLYPGQQSPVQLTSWAADCWSLSWSPDGKYLAFVSNATQDEEIYLLPAEGGTPVNLTQSPGSNDFLPTWSPDGQKIMFIANREEGANLDIYVMNADGSAVTRLTTSQARDTSPSWSPDGSKIAFVSDREGNFEVFVMDYPARTEANGGTPIRLTNTAQYEWSPTWSPDGKYIAFTSLRDSAGQNENYQVYTMNADGSNQTRLTQDTGNDIIPRWWP